MTRAFSVLKNINVFSGKCFVHASYGTEFTAHTASIAVVIFRASAVTDRFCSFRVKGTCILCIPVQFLAGSSHAVIDVSCSRNTLRNIRCVSCDLGSDDTLLGILHIRQSQVFSRCNIAKESSTVHSGNCTSDRCSDMVISRSNVGYKRTKYIKRSTHADTLLYFHVGGNLIQRHMDLEPEEALAIRWHMGAYDNAVKGDGRALSAAMEATPWVWRLHQADMCAAWVDEREAAEE